MKLIILRIFRYFNKIILKIFLAHEDGIWAVAWRSNETDNSENITTGGLDDVLKCWKW